MCAGDDYGAEAGFIPARGQLASSRRTGKEGVLGGTIGSPTRGNHGFPHEYDGFPHEYDGFPHEVPKNQGATLPGLT